MMNKNKKRIIFMVVILAVLFFAIPFVRTKLEKKDESNNASNVAIPVRVQKIELQDIQKTLEYIGNVKAQDEVLVYPKVSGKVIEKIKKEGDSVNKGETIVYIDRDEVGLKFEKAPVESPLDGIIGDVNVDIGSHVTPQTAVALVVSMEKMKIALDIPEIYSSKISLGQEAYVSVDAYPQEIFKGKVEKITPVLNLLNRAFPVEIKIENQDYRLKSGMFTKATLVLEKHENVPLILKEALIGSEPEVYVYVIENNKAVLRKIKLGIRQAENIEVIEGLKENDLVVIVGQQRLYENAPVQVELNSKY